MANSSRPKPPVYFASPAEFRDWLDANHGRKDELLVGFHKRGTSKPSLTWPQSVDEALCVGWIDGVRKRVDEERYTIRFTPRRPGSIWSTINIARVKVLETEGRMRPAGRAAFAKRESKKSRIYAYEQRKSPVMAQEHRNTFEANVKAWAFFRAQPPGYQRLLTFWIVSAKRSETQLKRLTQLIATSEAGKRMR